MLPSVVIYRGHLRHSTLIPSSLPTAPTPIEDLDPGGIPPAALATIALSFLSTTLMELPVSVASKRLTVLPKPFKCNTCKKRGAVASDCPPSLHSTLPPIFRTLFQVPYPASPLFATLAKTAGVCTNNSHSGTRHSSLAIPPAGSILWLAL